MPCGGFGERVDNTMAESKNYIVQPQEGGNILISEDVIASIASLAVREVEGVYGLSATQTLDVYKRQVAERLLRRGHGADRTTRRAERQARQRRSRAGHR